MKRITETTFEKLYKQHLVWLEGKGKGEQLNFTNCSFTKGCLTGKQLQHTIFKRCDFSGCDLTNTSFENSTIQNCDFKESQFLSVNAFGFSKIYGTKLPFSYSNKIEAVNDHCSKYKMISLLYFIVCIYYILFSTNASYIDFFMNRKIAIPNPFFDLTGTISYTGMLCFGIAVVLALDKFLIPLTLEILAMIRTLPIVFPEGEKISVLLSKYFLLRWITELQLDFNGKLPVENIRHKYLGDKIFQRDYKNITNHTVAFFRFLDFICLYLFSYRILHIYFYDNVFFNISEQDLQMILGSIFIMTINKSGNYINIITEFLLIASLAIFLDYNGVGTFLTRGGDFRNLSVLLTVISVASYYLIPKIAPMGSVLPIYAVIILIIYSNLFLTNVSLEGAEFSEWNGQCINEKIDIYKNKRFQNANLRNIKATNIDFKNSNFSYTDLRNADLRCSDFTNSKMDGTDIEGANLINAIGIKNIICKTKNYSKAKLDFIPDCK